MQVKPNSVDAARAVIVKPVKPRPAPTSEDTTSFSRVEALETSLQATPAVRPEAVSRAQELVRDVKYPPQEAINGIAALLALNWDAPTEA